MRLSQRSYYPYLARPKGFEPPFFRIGICCVIQLRHGRINVHYKPMNLIKINDRYCNTHRRHNQVVKKKFTKNHMSFRKHSSLSERQTILFDEPMRLQDQFQCAYFTASLKALPGLNAGTVVSGITCSCLVWGFMFFLSL